MCSCVFWCEFVDLLGEFLKSTAMVEAIHSKLEISYPKKTFKQS